jgi:WD40 repeat protein/energy-coupling factor transporter ATP-binding protein EcfA2
MRSSVPLVTLEKFTDFGDLLRFLRRRAGITQIDLSIAVGYSHAQISRLEQNLRQPDLPTIEARFLEALMLRDEPQAAARLLALAAKVRREDAPAPGDCPYKGLNYFDERDAELFVGRQALTERLVKRLLDMVSRNATDEKRFLAIVGASGSGKSSLLRAGVLPALRFQRASAKWPVLILTPTAHPIESLARALTQKMDSVAAAATLMDDLARDGRSLDLYIKRELQNSNAGYKLLVIDQFEELFAICRSEGERAAFIDNLLTAASTDGGQTLVVIIMRADFYAHCANYPQLREALARQQEYIGAMSDEELRAAIEEPAKRRRWELEPGLADLILQDAGHAPGALPLASHALMETWERRRGRTMTLSGYRAAGGVSGAIAETAETVFTDQLNPEQQLIARRIFLRLTELGEETGSAGTSRRASFRELVRRPDEAAATESVVKALADARLVTTSEDAVQVAHEALIRNWPRLRNWLEENREGFRLHRNLTEAAAEWLGMQREEGLLYRGARLAQAREWAVSHREDLNLQELEFLEASIGLSERETAEREAQRQRELEAAQKLAETESRAAANLRRRAMYLRAALGVAAILAVAALVFASRANQNALEASRNALEASRNQSTAEQQAHLASSRELAAAAVNNLETDSQLSILLALEALKQADTSEAENALHQGILAARLTGKVSAHAGYTYGVAISPDGSRFASAGMDGLVKIWLSNDLTAAAGMQPVMTIENPIDFDVQNISNGSTVAFSPDGSRLAAVAEKEAVKIWDAGSGELQFRLAGRSGNIPSLAFSADGKRLVTAHQNGQAMIWDVSTGKRLRTITLPGGAGKSTILAVFTPDERQLVTSGTDGYLRFWDLGEKPGQQLFSVNYYEESSFSPAYDPVVSISFSPDSEHMAVGTCRLGIVWDLRQLEADAHAKPLVTLVRHGGCINSISYTPDGSRLVTGSADGTAKVWDATTGKELFSLRSGFGSIWSMAVSPDGMQVLSAHENGSIAVWDISPRGSQEWWEIAPVDRGDFSSDGKRLMTGFLPEDLFQVWRLSPAGAELNHAMQDFDNAVIIKTMKAEADLGLLASTGVQVFTTTGADLYIKLWDPAAGKLLKSFAINMTSTARGHTGWVLDMDFSPDGTRLATAGADGYAYVWDLASGNALLSLMGHESYVMDIAYSPDGKLLATGSWDGTARLWDAQSGQLLRTLYGKAGAVYEVDFSPDGKRLVTANRDKKAIVWDVQTGEQLLTLSGQGNAVMHVDYSPDGSRIATGTEDNIATVWDASSGEAILSIPGTGVQFSPDGKGLMVISADYVARGYYLDTKDLIALARSRLIRGLTTAECKKYLHVEACPAAEH